MVDIDFAFLEFRIGMIMWNDNFTFALINAQLNIVVFWFRAGCRLFQLVSVRKYIFLTWSIHVTHRLMQARIPLLEIAACSYSLLPFTWRLSFNINRSRHARKYPRYINLYTRPSRASVYLFIWFLRKILCTVFVARRHLLAGHRQTEPLR
jgi:hypothetical protein